MSFRKFVSPIRSILTINRSTGLKPLAQISLSSAFSTDSTSTPSRIYELRVYCPYPAKHKQTLELFQKYIGLRTKHSKLVGFWTAEIGESIFQLVHIWEYESLSQRRNVRQKLAGDKDWNMEFLPKFMPLAMSMTNNLMVPLPHFKLNLDFKNDPTSVYSLQTVQLNGTPSHSFQTNCDGETLVGRFQAVFGPSKTEYRLWRYTHIDAALAGTLKRAQDSPEDGSSVLLYPTGFSPIQ